jgi:hypothetical protein
VFAKPMVLPLSEIVVGEAVVKAPHDIDMYLCQLYGDDCMTVYRESQKHEIIVNGYSQCLLSKFF